MIDIKSGFPEGKYWQHTGANNPDSKPCSLRGKINDSMAFNGLDTGDYRYILKAADDASGEVILVDRPFRVQ